MADETWALPTPDGKPIPQFRSYVDKFDYQYLEPVFENNYIAEGPFASRFHDKLLEIIGARYGCFANNGTLAIYLALKAMKLQPGDEVIVQDSTFIASANAVEMVGARPVFTDVVAFDDLTVDLDRVKLTPKTRALMLCHLFGTACTNIAEVQAFCRDQGIALVEDAAQTLAIKGPLGHCGTFGQVGTFSFYADKTITTGEGGFVVTDDEALYDRMLYLRNQGRKQSGTFIHPELGYNFRITDIQAALGLAQLEKLSTIVREKQSLYTEYQQHLSGAVKFLKLADGFSHIPFRVVVFVPHAEQIMAYMKERGIEPRSVFYPLHRQPSYHNHNYSDDDFPEAIKCYEQGICLPTWVGLTREQIAYVSQILIEANHTINC
jgi:perosamine synthetase